MAGRTKWYQSLLCALTAEALACRDVGAVAGWDIQHVVVETDSQNLVNLLNTMDGHSAAISAGSDGNPRA